MKRSDYGELAAFACVARLRSFRRAADEMGVSASALSHAVRGLEERLGVRLLNRSTRSVMPTEAGARLLDRLDPALSDIALALDELNAFRDTPRGALRLNVPRIAMRAVLLPILRVFRARYPAVVVEVVADDGLVDIVAEGFDAGIRFGERLAADRVALPIGPPQRFIVVASPAYLATHPAPRTPEDVLAHACIGQRFPSGVVYRWEFARAGVSRAVEVKASLIVNDHAMALDAAQAGLGLAYVLASLATDAIEAGALVPVLDDWMPPAEHFYLYTSGRRQMPAPLRAFIDLARELS
ncbi:MAG: LysR family transcriptional regulator [Denitromonas halophila]|nr:MAG: LysR family transcriptional regulator [Denitromonas halophila]